MQDDKHRIWLSFIERSHLLFETREELLCFLRGPKERHRPNSVVRTNRTSDRIKQDYEKLEDLACTMTLGEISKDDTFGQDTIKFSSLLDIYREAVNSDAFLTPQNTRSAYSKVRKGSFFYEGVYTPKKLAALIVEFLTAPKEESRPFYERLGLKIYCNESMLNNYQCAIGLLLLIGAIPLSRDNGRFRGSVERLMEDTAKMVSLSSGFKGMSQQAVKLFQRYKRANQFPEENWCRLLLIYYTVVYLNNAAIENDPRLLERRSRNSITFYPFDDNPYWCSTSNGNKEYYEFRRHPKYPNYTAYIYRYRYESHKLIKERFDLFLYAKTNRWDHNRVMNVSPIDYTYSLLTSKDGDNIKPGACEGRFGFRNRELTLIPPEGVNWMNKVTLIPIDNSEMPEEYSKCETKDLDKAEENLYIGSLDAIFRDRLVFNTEDGNSKTVSGSFLEDILPKIHVTDTIKLYHLGNKEYILMTIDGKITRIELPATLE